MVAKIYKDAKTASARKEKIEAMVQTCEDYQLEDIGLTEQIAWPLLSLYDDKGQFVGFAMAHMDGQFDLDSMYVYPPTKNANLTLKEKVGVLIDLCDLVEVVHLMDQVIGDFNPDNIKLKADRSVCFLDADSFHVTLYGKLHKCIVCAPGYVAPEVVTAAKGYTYATCPAPTFTKYSDNFALAIHIFRMLRNGAHPFVAQYDVDALGSLPAPEPVDYRVAQGLSPLYHTRPGESLPVYVPSSWGFPPYINNLFESAFSTNLFNPAKRPTARDWREALIRYESELIPCKKDPTHYYWNKALKCPYCDAADRTNTAVAQAMAQTKPVRNIPLGTAKNGSYRAATPRSYPAAGNASNGSNNYLGNGQYYANKGKMGRKLKAVTQIVGFIMMIILASTMYTRLYNAMFDHGFAVALCTFGTILFGFIGIHIHNNHVLDNRCPRGSDYVTALLAGFAMSLAFIPIAGIFALLAGVAFQFLKGALIFIIACAIVGGLISA